MWAEQQANTGRHGYPMYGANMASQTHHYNAAYGGYPLAQSKHTQHTQHATQTRDAAQGVPGVAIHGREPQLAYGVPQGPHAYAHYARQQHPHNPHATKTAYRSQPQPQGPAQVAQPSYPLGYGPHGPHGAPVPYMHDVPQLKPASGSSGRNSPSKGVSSSGSCPDSASSAYSVPGAMAPAMLYRTTIPAHRSVSEPCPSGGSGCPSGGMGTALLPCQVRVTREQMRYSMRRHRERYVVAQWYVGEMLGRGGFSHVRKGYDKSTGRVVALKMVLKDLLRGKDMTRVETEIEALRKVSHNNVVRLLAYQLNCTYPDKSKGKRPAVMLVLQHMAGGDLFDLLSCTDHLVEGAARFYFQQLVSALEACHAAGVCHRDIKPQNLLLDESYNLKLADFGLSAVFHTDQGQFMMTREIGTKGYRAPEVCEGGLYTKACDIFSCGVVLFILLAGYSPFEDAPRCPMYKPLQNGDVKGFWSQHKSCAVRRCARDLITRMLWYDHKKRITLRGVCEHVWNNGEKFTAERMRSYCKTLFNQKALDAAAANALPEFIRKLQLKSPTRNINLDGADAKAKEEEEDTAVPVLGDEQLLLTDVLTDASPRRAVEAVCAVTKVCHGAISPQDSPFDIQVTLATIKTRGRKLKIRVCAFRHLPSDGTLVRFTRVEGDPLHYVQTLKEFRSKCQVVWKHIATEEQHDKEKANEKDQESTDETVNEQ